MNGVGGEREGSQRTRVRGMRAVLWTFSQGCRWVRISQRQADQSEEIIADEGG